MKDYYEILGVSRTATDAELKKAFRALAMKYHPDRNAGEKASEEKFKEINEAYSCLSDPAKRANYDRYGSAGGPGAGYGPFGAGAGAGFGDIFEDIFGDFFGGFSGQRGKRPARGSDLRYDLSITLTEAVFGTEKTIEFPRWDDCAECRGTGSEPGKDAEICTSCNGTGQTRFQQGFFSVAKTCGRCSGAGRIISHPCKACHGKARVKSQKTISVKFPAGVDTGSRMKVQGEGDPGVYGGPRGDLYIILQVEEHPFFLRDGTEIICEMPVTFAQAALGAEIEVPTLDGAAKLKIPAGTPSGKVFHLKGKGAPRIGSTARGNQVVRVVVDVPKKLTPRQKELLEEFASIEGAGVSRGFKDRLKDIFSSVEH